MTHSPEFGALAEHFPATLDFSLSLSPKLSLVPPALCLGKIGGNPKTYIHQHRKKEEREKKKEKRETIMGLWLYHINIWAKNFIKRKKKKVKKREREREKLMIAGFV